MKGYRWIFRWSKKKIGMYSNFLHLRELNYSSEASTWTYSISFLNKWVKGYRWIFRWSTQKKFYTGIHCIWGIVKLPHLFHFLSKQVEKITQVEVQVDGKTWICRTVLQFQWRKHNQKQYLCGLLFSLDTFRRSHVPWLTRGRQVNVGARVKNKGWDAR